VSAFHDLGKLVDGDLELVLAEAVTGDSAAAYDSTYDCAMCLRDDAQPAGRIALRIWASDYYVRYAGHVAYSVVPEHRGHRYAARSCRLLLPLARRHGLTALWITCDPDDVASRRTCELVGAQLVEVVDVPAGTRTPLYERDERRKCRYHLGF